MEIPYLKDNRFAVGKAENATGHVLRNDGLVFRNGQGLDEMYEIFYTYNEAEEFALPKIKDIPEIECWIVNSNGDHVITYDKWGKRKYST